MPQGDRSLRPLVLALAAIILAACSALSIADPLEPMSCRDGIQNEGETGVDCGGPCKPCGTTCTPEECEAGICTGDACVGSCNDGQWNGNETDVDCGGSCPGCKDGWRCSVAEDCKSGVCTDGKCAVPTCSDGVKNGGEGDVDCGGSCPACPNGSSCEEHTDCASGACVSEQCVPSSCMDKLKNGNETDVDCGGACPGCLDGDSCLENSDCGSGYCMGNICAPASCNDGTKNGNETDVDCGGACAGCELGKACKTGSDCQTGSCSSGVCTPPGCNDDTKNGDETGVDCGGPTCGPCGDKEGCASDSDCASGICDEGTCRGDSAVFSVATPQFANTGYILGKIEPITGRSIRIVKVGICGDASFNSGQQGFRATDFAGLEFTWGAGQNDNGNVTHKLDPTPDLGGSARGFSYKVIDAVTQPETTVTILFQYRFGFNGLYCDAADEDGVKYKDASNTTRAWVRYRYE